MGTFTTVKTKMNVALCAISSGSSLFGKVKKIWVYSVCKGKKDLQSKEYKNFENYKPDGHP